MGVSPGSALLAAGAEVHQHDAAVAVAHHVVGFDIAVQQARAVHGGERFADVEADQRCFARAEAAALLQDLFERLALDQLHPQADHAFGARGAVDRHDIGMIDLGEQARLVNDGVGIAAADRFGDQLERDFAIEARVPGTIDGAVGAAADHLAQGEVRPGIGRKWFVERGGVMRRSARDIDSVAGRGKIFFLRGLAMEVRDVRDHLQLVEQLARLRVGCGGVELRPIDGFTVGDGLRD